MRIEGEIEMEVSYYNELLASWEPLLEPVMEAENQYRPWEVIIKVSKALLCISKLM